MMQRTAYFLFTLVLVASPLFASNEKHEPTCEVPSPFAAAKPQIRHSLDQLPLYFLENQGQVDDEVAFYIQGKDKTLYFTAEGVTLALEASDNSEMKRWVTKLKFIDANPIEPVGQDEQAAKFSYFKGNKEDWKSNLRTYSKILYSDLWPGIDLIYSGTVNQLKYEFVVKPGANPAQIRMVYEGITDMQLLDSGALQVTTPAGFFEDKAPFAYQKIAGEVTEVLMQYVLDGNVDSTFGYHYSIGDYDPSHPLVLDPALYVYSGFIGGYYDDSISSIAVDHKGCVYVCGRTKSDETTFPVLIGPELIKADTNKYDAFVAKIKADGSGLEYCGYIGGAENDHAHGIALDSNGNVYIAGFTESSEATFPVTVGPFLEMNTEGDAFVAKVNADGTALDYCGYIGGAHGDVASDIAVDNAGCAYIAGWTNSDETTFPVKVGPDLVYGGGIEDAFIAKVDALGAELEYCGYVDGNLSPQPDSCYAYGVDVDANGNAYISGMAGWLSNGSTGYCCKVSTSGSELDYFTSIGVGLGGGVIGYDVAVDAHGCAYVVGDVLMITIGFPVLIGPDLTHNGGFDGYVGKLDPNGEFEYLGYIGGSLTDSTSSIAVDNQGNAYVVGVTMSPESSFPVNGGPDLTFNGGSLDTFIAKVHVDGSTLDYCGYIGGSKSDTGTDCAVDRFGHVYVVGHTESSEFDFPVLVGPDLTHNGPTQWSDGFITKVALPLAADRYNDPAATFEEIQFDLNTSADNGDRLYFLLASVTGTSPGTPLPGGLTLPLNWDWYTNVIISLLNTPYFEKFQGNLDQYGHSTATLRLPVIPPVHIGLTVYYAYVLYNPFDFVSNTIATEIVP